MASQEELRTSLIEAADLLEKSANLKTGIDQATQLLEKTVLSTTSGTFAQREHLDTAIGDITRRNTPFLDRVAKVPANGLTHEWDIVTALGSNDTATDENGTPPVNEATIERFSAQIKTFATRVEVSDRAQWGASDYFDLQNLHLERGIRKILHDVETKVFYGDATSAPSEFDGIYQLVTNNAPVDNLIDASTATISQTLLDQAIQSVIDQGGVPTHIFMGAKDLKDFAALWANKVVYNDPGTGMTFGYNVGTYLSFAGPLEIVLDPFITGTVSPNTPNTDVFVLTLDELALAESEPMYKLPVYRALNLAETQTVVWNCVLEMRVPHYQSVIFDLG
jgi:hypothetical protein